MVLSVCLSVGPITNKTVNGFLTKFLEGITQVPSDTIFDDDPDRASDLKVLSPKSKYSGLAEVCAICVPYI